ncbi:MAG: APC family permease [Candidatus ainarchaeum sp.]|nr:APC family permease [Candidatus ainarchaeum sp.]
MPLKRQLSLVSTTLYGIGIILGAGVYALIGTGAAFAGNMLWLAFLLASLIAVFTALSYAELSSMFAREAAEYVYTRRAFGREALAFLVGLALVMAGVVSAALVALAFGGYLSFLAGGSAGVYAVALLAVMSFLNYWGIRESAGFNNVSTVIEAGGLALIVVLGFLFGPRGGTVDYFQLPATGFSGIVSAIGVIYFAFIGFENIANVSEEVRDAKRNVPKAILLSVAVCAVLYVLVSVAVLMLAGAQELASSQAPLALAASKVIPQAGLLLSCIALFATANTVLIILVSTSRILYGVSRECSLPAAFSRLGARGTPAFSAVFAGAAAAAASTYGNLTHIAQLTDLGVFIAYFFVNAALMRLRFSRRARGFTSPSVRGIPVFAVLGALTSLFMLACFEPGIWLAALAILSTGMLAFLAYKKFFCRAETCNA